MRTRAAKAAYDKARYQLVRDKKIASAQKWYQAHKTEKSAYDIARRPRKNALRRSQYAADPELVLAAQRGVPRRKRNLRQYGITVSEFDLLLAAQGRRCACCKSSEPKGNNWCVDHDHVTGKLRGILCVTCNTGIGGLGDNLPGVLNAVTYLEPDAPRVDEHY